jgi:hypothetical protein
MALVNRHPVCHLRFIKTPGGAMLTEKRLEAPVRHAPGTFIGLAWLLGLLLAISLPSAIMMVVDPTGAFGMSPTLLERAPIDSLFWMGMFLFGLSAALATSLAGMRFRWQWPWAASIQRATGLHWSWLGAVASGAVLVIFEIVELFFIDFSPVLHPMMLGFGVGIIGLASTRSVRAYLAATRR